jgi:hypothetical protein
MLVFSTRGVAVGIEEKTAFVGEGVAVFGLIITVGVLWASMMVSGESSVQPTIKIRPITSNNFDV